MDIIKFTPEELKVPKHRARFIRQMPLSMRGEVLDMFQDMASGGDGGGAWNSDGKSVRKTYESYRGKPDSWFQAVLSEYELLESGKT
jgi:hypothetical protein